MKLWLLIGGCLSVRDRRDADTSLGEAEKLCKNFYEGTRFYLFFSYALGRFFQPLAEKIFLTLPLAGFVFLTLAQGLS